MLIAAAVAWGAPGLDAQRFDPAPAWTGRQVVRGAPDLAKGAWAASSTAGWAWRPVALVSEGRALAPVEHLAGVDLVAAWAPRPLLRLAVGLPVAGTVGEVPAGLGTVAEIGDGGVGPGDLWVEAQLVLRGLGGSVRLGAPTGRRRALLGGTGPWARVDGSAERTWGRWTLAADLGLVVRAGAEELAGHLPSHELGVGLAVGLDPTGDRRFATGAELVAGTVLARFASPSHTPVEAWLTGGYDPDGPLAVDVGFGPGLGVGVGAPRLRGFARVTVRGRFDADPDGDGLRRGEDACPSEPEDADGFEDADGCPDPDDDRDGLPDGSDACPREPEDADGFQDEDGCPDPDDDGDGVPDARDRCPREPEDRDGFQDEDGCPDPDDDLDGVPDDQDQCPGLPETRNGFQDADGCPDARPVGPAPEVVR